MEIMLTFHAQVDSVAQKAGPAGIDVMMREKRKKKTVINGRCIDALYRCIDDASYYNSSKLITNYYFNYDDDDDDDD